jgi:hypothetical protein
MWIVLDAILGYNPENFIMWMDNESPEENHWYKIIQRRMYDFDRQEQSLKQNFPLTLALIFSFILAAIGALLGAYLTYHGLKLFSNMAWWKLEHMRRYNLLISSYGKRNNEFQASFAVVGDL